MIRKPAHKSGTAGQIVNDITLSDYIERKYPENATKYLTFEAWWSKQQKETGYNDPFQDSHAAAKAAWIAALENK